MTLWHEKVDLSDIMQNLDSFKIRYGPETARRLERVVNRDYVLDDIIIQFEMADCMDTYNEILDKLYDWGNYENRLWIETGDST
jgi:hypothetical protein